MHMYDPNYPNHFDTNMKHCPKCGMYYAGYSMCSCELGNPGGIFKDFGNSGYIKELEDKVETLEEALKDVEVELSYKEAQLELALNLAMKAHELREKIDKLTPYKDQPLLPFGDFPD